MNINRLDQEYLKKLTVLYVEDDADTREQFSEFLYRPVGTLITAANGAEGLEKFVTHQPDIIVTDILMPHMDGLTMSYEIRSLAPNVPIIVITAFEQTDYLMRAINIGIDKYVTKPVNSYLLFECLLECAHRLRAEEQLRLERQREIQTLWARHHKTVATLAGGIAHDYNNLLQSIFGYVSLADAVCEPQSKCEEYLKQVEKCTAEARTLSNMLHILGEGNISERLPIQPHEFFKHILTGRFANSDITLTTDYSDNLPSANAVEYQLHMAFSALADNAAEAMPNGGYLHLSACSATVTEQELIPLEQGNYLHISLADSGKGIPSDIIDKIFDPYFSTKHRGSQRGMGLSLALCQTIVMKHGGMISVESTPGEGSTFHLWLPAL